MAIPFQTCLSLATVLRIARERVGIGARAMRFSFVRDFPSWLSATAAITVVLLAIFQAGPALRYLNLQARNDDLLQKNTRLEVSISEREEALKDQERDLRFLSNEIEGRKKEEERLIQDRSGLINSIAQFANTMTQQQKMSRQLAERLESLQNDGEAVRVANARLLDEKTALV